MKKNLFFAALTTGLLLSSVSFAQLNPTTVAPTIDGTPTEWGALGTAGAYTEFTGVVAATVDNQFQAEDAIGDDNGDGTIIYPTDGNYAGGTEYDAASVRLAWDATNLYILFSQPGPDSDTFTGYSGRWAVYIDRATIATGSDTTQVGNHSGFAQSPNANFLTGFNWDFHISNRAGFQSLYTYQVAGDVSDFPPAGSSESESVVNNCAEVAVPWTVLGGTAPAASETFRLVVGLGGEDSGNWRDVTAAGGAHQFGGSLCDADDCKLIDLIGGTGAGDQAGDLACSGIGGTPVTIDSCIMTVTLAPASSVADWQMFE